MFDPRTDLLPEVASKWGRDPLEGQTKSAAVLEFILLLFCYAPSFFKIVLFY